MSGPDSSAPAAPAANRYDLSEWAGAFGDLGTLIPFVVAYIGVLGMDPCGILFAFGLSMIVCGLVYRTPFPVQPMKAVGAIAATQAAQSLTITPAVVHAAGFATGLVWLVLGATGAATRIAALVGRPVTTGIVLGLGMGFMLEGIRMMATDWLPAAIGLGVTLLLLSRRALPAMFVLLVFGAAWGVVRDPAVLQGLGAVAFDPRLPQWTPGQLTAHDLLVGFVFLALPQLPLTLGNAVIAITEENNRLFPARPVTTRRVALSTGVMNLFGAASGGVPMCHGAGGMAGHVRFGARTGGAPVILGGILLVLGLGFSTSVQALFAIFPKAILGVILFLTGAQLALGSCDFGRDKNDRFTVLVTAAFAVWNVGAAFVVGLAVHHLSRRGWLRL